MKTAMRRALLIMMSICILLGAVACTGTNITTDHGKESDSPAETVSETVGETEGETDRVTDTETVTEQQTQTDSATEQVTEQITEEETTGAYINNTATNHVKYELITNTIKLDGFDPELVGQIMTGKENGAITLMSADFDDGDAKADGMMVFKDEQYAKVVDGKLAFRYEESDFCISGHSVMSPDVDMASTDYLQVQLSMDIRSFRHELQNDRNPWVGTIIGCYTTANISQCDAPGNGIWFSLVPEQVITVYVGNAQSWPTGAAQVAIPKGFGDEEVHIDIICTDERSVYLYAKYSGEDTKLLLHTEATENEVTIYDGEGNLLKTVENNIATLGGSKFSVFSHMSVCTVDNLNVYAAQKNIERIEKEVKATPEEGYSLGLDMTDKTGLVSICYSVWFTGIIGAGDTPVESFNNMTLAIEGKQPWGGTNAFHYWAKPAQGYYRSTDKQAAYNNLKMIGEAGIDFIILDFTNYHDLYVTNGALGEAWAWAPARLLCETVMEMRAEGLTVPYIVFWCPNAGLVVDKIYKDFYQNEDWTDCFVYWNDKPFILSTGNVKDFPEQYKETFTTRRMWGLTGDRCWRFLNINNRGTVFARNEQLSVAVASQETYMSAPTAHGRNHGIFFYEQWCEAFRIRPKVVTVTWWNEWCAQRLLTEDGTYQFTDAYLAEYSRDIEPMEGGHGDLYYRWLCKYVADYKAGVKICPRLVEEGY